LAARPADTELNAITRTNNMLSNFVVSYFFKILQSSFSNILYQEFIFDFVKREGGWKEFVQYSRQEGHSTDFLKKTKRQSFNLHSSHLSRYSLDDSHKEIR
jgi:hypothetical protein